MGKASSSKKVARAARAGGRVSARQPRSLMFPSVLALIVILGVALVVYARDDRLSQDLSGPPQLGEHIHVAIGVYVCDQFLTDLPEFESQVGIHTHGDGVLHIHPFSQLGVGANATLGQFLKDARTGQPPIDVTVSDSKLRYVNETFTEGKTKCKGVKDPVFRLAWWEDVQSTTSKPIITTGDFNARRLTTNGGGITLYYGAADAEIPKPLTAANLAELGAVDGGDVTATTVAGETTTTVAGDTTTTVAGETTTTAVAGDTTTTAAP